MMLYAFFNALVFVGGTIAVFALVYFGLNFGGRVIDRHSEYRRAFEHSRLYLKRQIRQ